MDYSPISKSYNSLNRSRSSSCSSPVTNRIYYQEVISNGNDTLVRSFSCDQFFRKDDSGQTQVWKRCQVSNFITPTKKLKETHGINNKASSLPKRLALEYPRKKSDTKAKLSLKYPDSEKSITNNNVDNSYSKYNSRKIKFTRETKMLITATVSAIALGIGYYYSQLPCTYNWDLYNTGWNKVYKELERSVFGQKEAVDELMKLWRLNSLTSSKSLVLTFTGGVGVGKTYVSSIINNNYPWHSQKHISFKNHIISEGEKYFSEKFSCGGHLVIIDDISILDSTKAIMLTNRLLSNFRRDGGRLLIILIFQTQNKEQENLIVSQIENQHYIFYHIPFKPLQRDNIERCFLKEIVRQNVVVSEDKLNKLVEEQMSYVDVLKGPPGCKGVSDQVAKFYLVS